MAATNTIEKDNPKLNVRDFVGSQPVRIILDRTLRLKKQLSVFDDTQKTIVFTEKSRKATENTEYIQIGFGQGFYEEFLKVLYEKEIQSVFVEGGGLFLQNLIDSGYWDEAREFIGNIHFKKGVKAPVIRMVPEQRALFSEVRCCTIEIDIKNYKTGKRVLCYPLNSLDHKHCIAIRAKFIAVLQGYFICIHGILISSEGRSGHQGNRFRQMKISDHRIGDHENRKAGK